MSDTHEPETPNPAPPANGGATFAFRAAYEETAAARAVLRSDELAIMNIPVSGVVHNGLAAAPKVLLLRPLIAQLPVDHALVDNLEVYARASGHSQALYVVSSAPPEELQVVYEDGVERRNFLKSDAGNLAKHGLMNADVVAAIKSDTGYRNVGYDLMSLVALFRGAADTIRGRCVTLPEDLDEAELIANQLLELAARRPARTTADPEISEQRARAFTLLMRSYDEARRAVVFLRWHHGDADTITPSLYAGRGKGKRSDEAPQDEVTEVIVAPVPTPEAGTEPNTNLPPGSRGGTPFA